jgi:hypothetical protein
VEPRIKRGQDDAVSRIKLMMHTYPSTAAHDTYPYPPFPPARIYNLHPSNPRLRAVYLEELQDVWDETEDMRMRMMLSLRELRERKASGMEILVYLFFYRLRCPELLKMGESRG